MKTINFKALGTDISIQIVDTGKQNKKRLEKITKDFFCSYEKIFSRFDERSELARLNNQLGKYQPASAEMFRVAQKSLGYFQKTAGYFDPRVARILENIGYGKSFYSSKFGEKISEKIENKIFGNLSKDLK